MAKKQKVIMTVFLLAIVAITVTTVLLINKKNNNKKPKKITFDDLYNEYYNFLHRTKNDEDWKYLYLDEENNNWNNWKLDIDENFKDYKNGIKRTIRDKLKVEPSSIKYINDIPGLINEYNCLKKSNTVEEMGDCEDEYNNNNLFYNSNWNNNNNNWNNNNLNICPDDWILTDKSDITSNNPFVMCSNPNKIGRCNYTEPKKFSSDLYEDNIKKCNWAKFCEVPWKGIDNLCS